MKRSIVTKLATHHTHNQPLLTHSGRKHHNPRNSPAGSRDTPTNHLISTSTSAPVAVSVSISTSNPAAFSSSSSSKMNVPLRKKPINLLRGWPSPTLLPAAALSAAAAKTLADPATYVPGLQYGPDPGYQPLREALARWLSAFYPAASPAAPTPISAPDAIPGPTPATATAASSSSSTGIVTSAGTGSRHNAPDVRRICVTGGASQNLACILQSFTDPLYTRSVWMAAPCYFLACPIFADAGFDGRMRAVPEDAEGVDVGYLRRRLETSAGEGGDGYNITYTEAQRYKQAENRKLYRHIIYLVPTCSNPTGKTMSVARRYELVQLAREYDALIICDDVYDMLQWPIDFSDNPGPYTPNMRLPRIVDIDRALGVPDASFGNAVSNGSFSKIVGPGLRTGWVEGSPAFAYGLSQTGSTRSGGAPSQLAAMLIAELLENGELQKHLEEATRPVLARRHRLMMRAIAEHIQKPFEGNVVVRESSLAGARVYGGYFVWFSLPEGMSSREAAIRAKETENLVIGHGGQFEVHGDEKSAQFGREIRLCFSWEPEEDVIEGVERLGRVLKAMKDGTRWKPTSSLDVDNVK